MNLRYISDILELTVTTSFLNKFHNDIFYRLSASGRVIIMKNVYKVTCYYKSNDRNITSTPSINSEAIASELIENAEGTI